MKVLVDLDRPHYLTLIALHFFPLILIHYLLVINLLLPLLWGVVEAIVEAEAKAVEVMNKGVVVEGMTFISDLLL